MSQLAHRKAADIVEIGMEGHLAVREEALAKGADYRAETDAVLRAPRRTRLRSALPSYAYCLWAATQ
jgi:hypothetical protein